MPDSHGEFAINDSVKTLIDRCIAHAGSMTALAQILGMTQPDLSNMASGKRTISPSTVGLMCNVLDLGAEEARRLAAHAIVDNAKKDKVDALKRAFFGVGQRLIEEGRNYKRRQSDQRPNSH